MPTIELPVSQTRDYSSAVRILKFDIEYSLCGGVNVPKLVICKGTDGKSYRQLVKVYLGPINMKQNDDLRQDAVLSKIFSICNILLEKDADTRSAKATIRTYKVIPLSPQTGLLEWIENTLPIGDFLGIRIILHTQSKHTRVITQLT
jgi:ataxia telangiectasia mutated family protein